MTDQLKARKCKRRECRKDYEPNTEWQKFCSDKCRDAMSNQKRAKRIREMRKFFERNAQQGAA